MYQYDENVSAWGYYVKDTADNGLLGISQRHASGCLDICVLNLEI